MMKPSGVVVTATGTVRFRPLIRPRWWTTAQTVNQRLPARTRTAGAVARAKRQEVLAGAAVEAVMCQIVRPERLFARPGDPSGRVTDFRYLPQRVGDRVGP